MYIVHLIYIDVCACVYIEVDIGLVLTLLCAMKMLQSEKFYICPLEFEVAMMNN